MNILEQSSGAGNPSPDDLKKQKIKSYLELFDKYEKPNYIWQMPGQVDRTSLNGGEIWMFQGPNMTTLLFEIEGFLGENLIPDDEMAAIRSSLTIMTNYDATATPNIESEDQLTLMHSLVHSIVVALHRLNG